MYVVDSIEDVKAVLLDENVQVPSEFAAGIVLPDSVSDLQYGDGEGVFYDMFFPDGDVDAMPPYVGVRLAMGYRLDQLDETDLVNEEGFDGAYFFEMYEQSPLGTPKYIVEMVVPISINYAEKLFGDDVYDWVYACGRKAFESACSR